MASPPDYLLVGHITADLTPGGRVAGGTVSYAARTAAAFGLRVGVLTSTATDEPLLDALAPYAEIICLPAEQTTTFENIYEPEGRKQFVRGIAAPIGVSDIPPHFLKAPLVHLAPIVGEGDPRIAHLFTGASVLLTLQGWLRRVDEDGRVRFKRWYDPSVLKSIDMVVFSEEDIVEAPEMEQDFVRSVSNLFVTRAERGGTQYHDGEATTYDTPQVHLINPTGAGDVFAAALLASLPALNYDLHAATKVAARLGAICVTRVGLDSAPTPEEVQGALHEAVRA
jgi:sugar/nucleoside kinase (ribokinase family)